MRAIFKHPGNCERQVYFRKKITESLLLFGNYRISNPARNPAKFLRGNLPLSLVGNLLFFRVLEVELEFYGELGLGMEMGKYR